MTQRSLLMLLALMIITLSACQPPQNSTNVRPSSPEEVNAYSTEESGDYLSAAQQYAALAEKTTKGTQAQYYLRATIAFLQAEQREQAAANLAKINRQLLSNSKLIDVAIVSSQLALSATPPQAEAALKSFDNVSITKATAAQSQQVLRLQIKAYGLTKNWLEKANSHLQLSNYLTNDERLENQQGLWQALTSMTPQSLDLFKPGMAPAEDSGWFELAYIVKSYQNTPETMMVAIENWQRDYPNHPANPTLYEQDFHEGTQLPQELNHIAILLPETGPYKIAAEAIKKGIITAHFISKSQAQLHFYAVSTEPSNVWQQYQQAIADSASVVIGPLDKRSVQALIDCDELPIPVLALNKLDPKIHKANLFQFALSPEDDAASIANYARQQNYSRAVMLYPKGSWGDRVSQAFKEQWRVNGGVLLGQAAYDSKDNDFSKTISPVLGLDSSTQRSRSLRQELSRTLEFEARRRHDIDFIFIAAKPVQARQLVPQLKFHRAASVPMFATSQAYTGLENNQQDIDLNKLIITDIPWILDENKGSDPIYRALKRNHPEYFDSFVRLYALGADAYRLVPNLNSLTRSSNITFKGATGILSINSLGKVNREADWGQFNKGILAPLSETSENE